jgi:DNA repair protein RadC
MFLILRESRNPCPLPTGRRANARARNFWPKGRCASDAELLAIFAQRRTGKERGRPRPGFLGRFGSLSRLGAATQKEFCEANGLGPAKFVQLQAVLEMARRALNEQLKAGDTLASPQAVRDYLRLLLQTREEEVFVAIFLDAQNRSLAVEELFRGTLTQTSVYPREVVKRALYHNAAGVIFAHNHPSGLAEPSRADENLTRHSSRRWRWSTSRCSTTSSLARRACRLPSADYCSGHLICARV